MLLPEMDLSFPQNGFLKGRRYCGDIRWAWIWHSSLLELCMDVLMMTCSCADFRVASITMVNPRLGDCRAVHVGKPVEVTQKLELVMNSSILIYPVPRDLGSNSLCYLCLSFMANKSIFKRGKAEHLLERPHCLPPVSKGRILLIIGAKSSLWSPLSPKQWRMKLPVWVWCFIYLDW